MSLTADILADCEDAVFIQFEAQQTKGLWKQRVEVEDGGGQLKVEGTTEHLVIATGSLVGLKKGSVVLFTDPPDYGGQTHTRKVQQTPKPKDDDRALTRVFLEKF